MVSNIFFAKIFHWQERFFFKQKICEKWIEWPKLGHFIYFIYLVDENLGPDYQVIKLWWPYRLCFYPTWISDVNVHYDYDYCMFRPPSLLKTDRSIPGKLWCCILDESLIRHKAQTIWFLGGGISSRITESVIFFRNLIGMGIFFFAFVGQIIYVDINMVVNGPLSRARLFYSFSC